MRAPMASPIDATADSSSSSQIDAYSALGVEEPTTAARRTAGSPKKGRIRPPTCTSGSSIGHDDAVLVAGTAAMSTKVTGVAGPAIDTSSHVGGVGLDAAAGEERQYVARTSKSGPPSTGTQLVVCPMVAVVERVLVAVDAELRAAERVQRAPRGQAGRRRIEEVRVGRRRAVVLVGEEDDHEERVVAQKAGVERRGGEHAVDRLERHLEAAAALPTPTPCS